jgi:hypothetical protein
MSAQIILFVPKANLNRQKDLERQAIEIANAAFPHVLEHVHYHDTAPSEYCAPDKDPA